MGFITDSFIKQHKIPDWNSNSQKGMVINMEIRFSVGEIADFYQISRQTVLFYDKEGVFKPKLIDKTNGYRYYTPDQLEELDTVLMLRSLGFSLKEIKEFMKNRDGARAVELLELQKERLEQKIMELNTARQRVEKKAEILNDYLVHGEAEIGFCQRKEEFLIVEPVEPPYQLLQADIAIKKLMNKTKENPKIYTYLTGTIISKENILKDNFLTASYMFFPLNKESEKKDCIRKPQGRYIRAYHKGTYDTIGKTYKSMVLFAQNNESEIIGNAYEYGILDNFTSEDPKNYVTEIQIQVK